MDQRPFVPVSQKAVSKHRPFPNLFAKHLCAKLAVIVLLGDTWALIEGVQFVTTQQSRFWSLGNDGDEFVQPNRRIAPRGFADSEMKAVSQAPIQA
jgi:hypothetical protein